LLRHHSPLVSRQQPADPSGDDSEQHQKPDIPGEPVRSWTNVMDPQNLVIDNAFHEVEQSCSNQEPAEVHLAARQHSSFCIAEEHQQRCNGYDPAERVE